MEKRRSKDKDLSKKAKAAAADSAQLSNGVMAKKSAKKRVGRQNHLDPVLLARGMSSRYLSSKISHQLTPLAKETVEKDLRHMEAYRNACAGYSQQLFVYKNQDLVRSGYFGTFAPFPGADGDVVRPAASASAAAMPSSSFSMPIKIDPEEEKRLSVLRKKIHQSEFEREKLETEYLSLRAHYVHESQLVRKTRSYEMGRWKLLRELAVRRSRALALMRVKVAVGRDIEALLKSRGALAEKVKSGEIAANAAPEKSAAADEKKDGAAAAATMNGDNGSAAASSDKNGSSGQEKKKDSTEKTKAVNLVEIWNDINAQLREAEMACVELETPAVLSQMVGASADGKANGGRSRSPTRSGGDGDKSASNGGRKRSGSITSEAETASNQPSGKKSRSPVPPSSLAEPHVIPWDCMVEPRTPYEVPLLLSCLSSATDRAVGYGKMHEISD